jgi:hypothetical protein
MSNIGDYEVVTYFIDEAGDPVLFNRRGTKVLAGNPASKFLRTQSTL